MNDPTLDDALALHKQGRLAEAAEIYRAIIAQTPNEPDAHNLLGLTEAASGRFNEALALIDQAIALSPQDERYHLNGAGVLRALGRFSEALEYADQAVDIRNDYLEGWMSRGQILTFLNRLEEALRCYDKAVRLRPGDAVVRTYRGALLNDMQDYRVAIVDFDVAIGNDPVHVKAYQGRAQARSRINALQGALDDLNRAHEISPGQGDILFGRGMILAALRHDEEALDDFEEALHLLPDDARVRKEIGDIFSRANRLADALNSFDRALELNPDYAEAHNSRGLIMMSLGRFDDALAAFDRAMKIAPALPEVKYNRAQTLSQLRRFPEAEAAFSQLVAAGHNMPFLQGHRFAAQLQSCDWSDYAARSRRIAESVMAGVQADTPFNFLMHGTSAALQLKAAQIFVETTCPRREPPMFQRPDAGQGKIKLAYLSADFNNHATMLLAAGLFAAHDRQKFEVTGMSFGADDGSEISKAVRSMFDRFIDVHNVSDFEAAKTISDLGIDIAVDLKGHTANSRPGILSYRPSPVQIQFLGFPATMGADYIDYIIADRHLVPEGQESNYAEKIIRLPVSYQVNDNRRPMPEGRPLRIDHGLPSEGFVFCCFNNSFKITPYIFDIWMRLLQNVPGSVLWLLESTTETAGNLRREASTRGVDPARLVFAKRTSFPQHLERHQLADLFLDTLPCNAHTTASDALWMSLPVLTCSGQTFTSRVCGSLLKAFGMPELVAESLADYETLALRIATSPEFLTELKTKAAGQRLASALFDVKVFRDKIETAYAAAWQRRLAGLPPAHIDVAMP